VAQGPDGGRARRQRSSCLASGTAEGQADGEHTSSPGRVAGGVAMRGDPFEMVSKRLAPAKTSGRATA
jgi:hypothetical protein